MWPQMVIEGYPVTKNTAGVLDRFKAVAMHTLFLDRSNESFDHAVLLWAMRGNELLLQSVALHQGCVAAGSKNQPVIRPKQEWCVDSAQGAIPADQGLLQSGFGSTSPTRAGEMPTQQLPSMAIHDDC